MRIDVTAAPGMLESEPRCRARVARGAAAYRVDHHQRGLLHGAERRVHLVRRTQLLKADPGQLVAHRLDEQGVVRGNVQTGHDASSEIGSHPSKFITKLGNNPPRTALPRIRALTPDPMRGGHARILDATCRMVATNEIAARLASGGAATRTEIACSRRSTRQIDPSHPLTRRLMCFPARGTAGLLVLLLAACSDLSRDPTTSAELVGAATAASYYVSPTGSPSGTGNWTFPWDLATALAGAGGVIHPGDTVWLRGGTYAGAFRASLGGAAGSPIVFRRWRSERATINGGLRVDGPDLVFWGFEIARSDTAVHDSLPGLQSQLAAYVVQFRYLRLLQRSRRRRIVSTGIDELRVEPELVKSGIKIVVVLDITTRAAQGVSLNIFHALRDEFDVPSVMFDLRYRAIKDFEGGDEISLQGNAPLAVRIAKFSFQFD